MLILKTFRLNTFLLVMDKLDLDAQFVHQFEDRNFRLLGRLIFLVMVSDLIGNCPWKIETSVSTEIECKRREIKSRICSWDIKRLREYLSLKFWLFFTQYACATKCRSHRKNLVRVRAPYL